MATKNKRGDGSARADGQPPRQEVDRLIAKGWYKDAVRQAKICHRDRPTPEHHRLLERAYLLRAQQLRDGGMPAAAQEVAGHLLDFGITDPELTEPAAALLLAVGMAGRALELQGRLVSPEAVERLNRQAADQAVLHPERASATPPAILEGARRVRSALEALTAGDEAKALDGLRDVARSSPFADWRLFARGLAASRRGEDGDARANWDRLDPGRSASRIARALTEATGPGLLDGPDAAPKREGLERWALGEPILGPLRGLAEAVARGLWPEAVRKLGPLRLAVRRLDPALAVRLTEALYSPLIREATGLDFREARDLVKGFTKAAEPLPIDPRWNRLWALVWDGPQGHPDEAEPFWRRYLDDLESSPAVRPEERPKARAFVLTHLGEEWADLAADLDLDLDPGGPRPRRPVDEEAMQARRRAVACLEESLALLPSRRATYRALIDTYEDGGQPDRAAEAARRLLAAIPDDLEALEHLSRHHSRRDEPARALEFTLRARKLKPLDPKTLQDEWACRVALARRHAVDGRPNEGRAELEAAGQLQPELAGSAHFSARRAALELKAGRPEAAGAILDGARGRLTEPAPLWLATTIEARRFQLPRAEVDRYEALWLKSAAGKVRGETAGALADLLGSFLAGEVAYPGRDEHAKQVADYLRRTTRIKYSRDDLSHACGFLGLAPGHRDLFEKLAKRGLKLFPDAPEFPMMLGSIEVEKGPYLANLGQARRHFEAALELAEAQASGDPKAAAMLPSIRQALTALNDLAAGPMGLPFSFPAGGKGPAPGGMLDAFEAMMAGAGIGLDDADFEPEGDDGGPAPAPTTRPRPKGRRR